MILVFTTAEIGTHTTYAATNTASIKLNKSSATLYVGSQLTLKATVTGASNKVTWTSSNTKIATVKNGKVTAKKAGKATIKAKANGKTAKCTITVKKAPSVYKKVTPKVKASIGKKTFSMEEASTGTGYYPIFVSQGGSKKKLIPENDASVVTTNGAFLYYSTRYSGIYRYDINTGEKILITSGNRITPLYSDGTYLYYGDQTQYVGVIENLKILNMKTNKVVTSPYPFADDIQPVKNRLLVSGTGRPHGSPLYFINKDGSKATLITKEYVNELKISGNYIYYQETTPGWTVRSCRCNLNGKNIKVLKDWHSLI